MTTDPDTTDPGALGPQVARGNQNVQIQHVAAGASIRVTFEGASAREVPLEAAFVPLPPDVQDPARLLRARAAEVAWSPRGGVLDRVTNWVSSGEAFRVGVVGGAGGSGKTRLGVELCRLVSDELGWLTGLLRTVADPEQFETLAQTPTPRLVVVDYAETRGEQLELLLPLLAGRATQESPVRVLLLVRRAPQRSDDWTEPLRGRGDALDVVFDSAQQLVLPKASFALAERHQLLVAAATTFAARLGRPQPGEFLESLDGVLFGSPLSVLMAGFLHAAGDEQVPATKEGLLREVARHQDTYWERSDPKLDADATLRRRVMALASLAGADTEAEAVGLLRVVPDLHDATAKELGQLARWSESVSDGPRWWNPLEPDLLTEYLAATSLAGGQDVLRAVLDRPNPDSIIRPLTVLARTVTDYPALRAELSTVLAEALPRLCADATAQVAAGGRLDVLLTRPTLAAALDGLAQVVRADSLSLAAGVDALPPRNDVILGPLALTLTSQIVAEYRRLAAGDPSVYEPDLAMLLNDLSNRLGQVGRRDEALAAIEEAVAVRRRLAAHTPSAHEPALATALNNLSNRMGEVGRWDEALAASEEAVAVRRRLAADTPAAYEPALASALNNLSVDLSEVGRRDEGLAAIEEAVAIYRRLAADTPAAYEPALASALNNLSGSLSEAERWIEGLAAIEEAVAVYRRLAADTPAAYEPDLATALNNLSNHLSEAGRRDEGLAAIEEAVAVCRRLVAGAPAAYEPDLATALNNLSNRLGEVGRRDEGLAAIEEAVAVRRRLAADTPSAHEPALATALYNLSYFLGEVGRRDEALAAIEEAVAVRRRLAAGAPAAYEPDLATALYNLSYFLGEVGRRDEALAAIEEATQLAALSQGDRDTQPHRPS